MEGKGGLKVDLQFELNPVKYLDSLISYLLKNGVAIFKNTEAKSVEKNGDMLTVETGNQHVSRCKDLVIATAYPFYEGNGFYFTRLEALRSYLLAFPIKEPLDDHYMMITHGGSPFHFARPVRMESIISWLGGKVTK
jgi:glycine/D-amino acid oxidase-like deaminating enzyme